MWYELKVFKIKPETLELVSDQLEELGALSVTWTDQNDDAILEPAPGTVPLWPETQLTALFNTEDEAVIAGQVLLQKFPRLSSRVQNLPDQAWERVCMDQFQAASFGQRLWICPSWCEPVDPQAVNVFLDPGMAFGTGTHPTSALCLEWLDQNPPLNQNLIDFGCGSGILAIAARKLGARKVYAVDIDPQALQASADNAQKNHCLDRNFIIDYPETLSEPCDVLLANILLSPLQTLKSRFADLLNSEGTLAVSGILTEQADALMASYKDIFYCVEQRQKDEWCLLVFRKTHTTF